MHTFSLESLEFLILVVPWSFTPLVPILEFLLPDAFSKRVTLTIQLKVRFHFLEISYDLTMTWCYGQKTYDLKIIKVRTYDILHIINQAIFIAKADVKTIIFFIFPRPSRFLTGITVFISFSDSLWDDEHLIWPLNDLKTYHF